MMSPPGITKMLRVYGGFIEEERGGQGMKT